MKKNVLSLILIFSSSCLSKNYTNQEIIEACKKGPVGSLVIKSIQEKTIDPNMILNPITGITLLMCLVQDGDIEAVRVLLNAKADVRKENKLGETALYYTQNLPLELFTEMINLLIEADKKAYPPHSTLLINHKGAVSRTLLHHLCFDLQNREYNAEEKANHLQKIKIIINYGANLDLADYYDKTPRTILEKNKISVE